MTQENEIKEYRLRLGEQIRTVREQKGMSQESLARMLEISRTTISKIENGCSDDHDQFWTDHCFCIGLGF